MKRTSIAGVLIILFILNYRISVMSTLQDRFFVLSYYANYANYILHLLVITLQFLVLSFNQPIIHEPLSIILGSSQKCEPEINEVVIL